MDRTLVICKPDAVERGLVGEIIGRFERKGFTLVAADLRTIDAETAGRHYAEHEGKPFYPELVEFIGRSPALVFVLEGPQDTWKAVRSMMGTTNPLEAAPGTVRGDLGTLFTENLVPVTLRDEREFFYKMAPATNPPVTDLLTRGEQLKVQAQAGPPPRRRGILGWLGF